MTCLRRLLRDLHTVEANLEFWQNRLHRGSHLRFMLFGQGPISFAHDVLSTLERKHRQRMTSATDKIERRVSSPLCITTTLCNAILEKYFDYPSLSHVNFVLQYVPMCYFHYCHPISTNPLWHSSQLA